MAFTVYADVLFAVNFVMDAFLFLLLRLFARRRARLWRVMLGAAVCAGLYCLAALFLRYSPPVSLPLSAFILSGGVAAAFCPLRLAEFGKLLAIAYALAFLLGGCANALLAGTAGFPFVPLIVAMAATYAAVKAAAKARARLALRKQAFCAVRVTLNGESAELTGLVDTGNGLVEPISGAPVVVAEARALSRILPPAMAALCQSPEPAALDALLAAVETDSLQTRVRFVPYSAVGQPGGVLAGFKPDCVTITQTGGKATPAAAVVALYNGRLANGYNALINPTILNDTL